LSYQLGYWPAWRALLRCLITRRAPGAVSFVRKLRRPKRRRDVPQEPIGPRAVINGPVIAVASATVGDR
jgi:hypothetical protein